jgi:hypothetical protein
LSAKKPKLKQNARKKKPRLRLYTKTFSSLSTTMTTFAQRIRDTTAVSLVQVVTHPLVQEEGLEVLHEDILRHQVHFEAVLAALGLHRLSRAAQAV